MNRLEKIYRNLTDKSLQELREALRLDFEELFNKSIKIYADDLDSIARRIELIDRIRDERTNENISRPSEGMDRTESN